MATSNTAICNLALIELGQETITALATDQSESARLCRLKWPEVRDAILRAAPWRCLASRVQLTRLVEVPAFRFAYMYDLPPDCFRVLSMSEPEATWQVEGRRLLTDEATAYIRYIAYDVATDPVARFDSLLTKAVVNQLAAELAPSLKSADRVAELLAIAGSAIADAKAIAASEGTPETVTCSALTTDIR